MKNNDLIDFMKSATKEIDDEYQRIQKRALEDPGTAGDQGEENWATLLRNWLPPSFQIVTKGRILSEKGIASPQVDIIVLQPEYPRHLLDKKLYLAGGVLAAFECKLTLKPKHIEDFIKNSIKIKKHLNKLDGTPFKELQSPLLYGLLAHSHNWTSEKSTAIEKIKQKIIETDQLFISHPYDMPDLVCIANLASWSASKITFLKPSQFEDWEVNWAPKFGHNGYATSSYICYSGNTEFFTPIGAMLTSLMHKLAWHYPNLRSISRYFDLTNLIEGGSGYMRPWESTIYSEHVKKQVENGPLFTGVSWEEWSFRFR
jgi:hypothetical protein